MAQQPPFRRGSLLLEVFWRRLWFVYSLSTRVQFLSPVWLHYLCRASPNTISVRRKQRFLSTSVFFSLNLSLPFSPNPSCFSLLHTKNVGFTRKVIHGSLSFWQNIHYNIFLQKKWCDNTPWYCVISICHNSFILVLKMNCKVHKGMFFWILQNLVTMVHFCKGCTLKKASDNHSLINPTKPIVS